MHLNAIWLLLGGIEKYVNYEPEFLAKPKKPIKIMQKVSYNYKYLAFNLYCFIKKSFINHFRITLLNINQYKK